MERSRERRRFGRKLVLVLVLVPAVAGLVACEPQPNPLHRPVDPVVLTGAALPSLLGMRPDDIVAFRHDGVRWAQLPVQVDERKVMDLGEVYNLGDRFDLGPKGVLATVYTDAVTWTGPDTDPRFDEDDELVFMARDVGVEAPAGAGHPEGVLAKTAVVLSVTDPTDYLATGAVVYLYRRARGLDPGAGRRYVDYTFSLASGGYRETFNLVAGPNPEDSVVRTGTYTRHFADRWLTDELRVTAPGATGIDILDRHKSLFETGYCGRSEETFNAGEGAFITNKSGPVRAIRAVMGANSGPYTTKTWVFYDQREDVVNDLRVHGIPGIIDYDDLSPDAGGMTYSNSINPAGVPVDGAPDALAPGWPAWQMIDGPQGSVQSSSRVLTDAVVPLTTYYEDAVTPAAPQCTGDASAYGNFGNWINGPIPGTDPRYADPHTLQARTIITYGSPGVTADAATSRTRQAWTPVQITPFEPPPPAPSSTDPPYGP